MLSNLFADLPDRAAAEEFVPLLRAPGLSIKRIVSCGHASPEGFWYDQSEDEWIVLLQGAARLHFEEGNRVLGLKPGDFVHIPAHRRHRVEWTIEGEPTIWLAVHFQR
jgi:cupin 2 domain-containing protein